MKYKFITAEQFAHAIVAAPMDTVFDFSFDQSEDEFVYGEPTGIYGAKITTIFDEHEGVFVIGYYGGGWTRTSDLYADCDGNIDAYIQEILEDYIIDNIGKNLLFCVEVTEDNKEYLERNYD